MSSGAIAAISILIGLRCFALYFFTVLGLSSHAASSSLLA
jgi:hypothetical protein